MKIIKEVFGKIPAYKTEHEDKLDMLDQNSFIVQPVQTMIFNLRLQRLPCPPNYSLDSPNADAFPSLASYQYPTITK